MAGSKAEGMGETRWLPRLAMIFGKKIDGWIGEKIGGRTVESIEGKTVVKIGNWIGGKIAEKIGRWTGEKIGGRIAGSIEGKIVERTDNWIGVKTVGKIVSLTGERTVEKTVRWTADQMIVRTPVANCAGLIEPIVLPGIMAARGATMLVRSRWIDPTDRKDLSGPRDSRDQTDQRGQTDRTDPIALNGRRDQSGPAGTRIGWFVRNRFNYGAEDVSAPFCFDSE